MRLSGHLCAAFHELGRRGHDKGCETTCCAGEEYIGEVGGICCGLGGGGEQGQCAVVGYEEKRVECAIGEDGGCCAYTIVASALLWHCYMRRGFTHL